MNVTIPIIALPITVNIILLFVMFLSIMNDDGWFAGLFQVIGGVIGTLGIWLVYFSFLYFTTK